MNASLWRSGLGALVSSVCFALALSGAENRATPVADTPDKDYSSEMPRIPPKSPAESLKTFKLRPGFRIDFVAAEPLIRDPVAADFDENGRLFVVELPEYNQYANKKPHGHGVVKMLEDTDGDGRFDKSTIYVDNLNYPTGVACWDGGVFVGAAPDLLYCKDTNGDGKADVREVVYTGFGTDHAGEAQLNSFRWGLDNRFHVATAMDGGDIRPAGDKKAKPLSVRGQTFVFDPRTRTYEATSGGGQHGLSMDDWGRTFVCANSDPIHLMMYDSRYLARNPYVQAPPAAINIAPAGKYTKVFRISSNEPWRVLRTRLRSKGIVPGSDEGGQPSGFFTAATGITVYRGDAWPDEYRGNVFVGEVSGNLIHRIRLEPSGVGLNALPAEKGVEFLASTDNWFRPVQFVHAPDGTLLVLDMYRELIEGAAFLAPIILKHIDVSGGVDKGRIYRIAPEGFKPPKPPRLGQATTAELVALLEHKNGWHRDTASRLLYQRQDPAAIVPLKKLASESKSSLGRLHALYALAGVNALEPAQVVKALDDPEPRLREHALPLAERFEAVPAIRAKLETMADDPDLRVRYQLAYSLGAVKGELPKRLLPHLALRDGADAWFRTAILTSAVDCGGDVLRTLIVDKNYRNSPAGRQFLGALATQMGAANRPNDIAAVVKAVDPLPAEESALTQELVRSLVAKMPAGTKGAYASVLTGKAAAVFQEMLHGAHTTALDEKKSPADRAAAVRTLGLLDFHVFVYYVPGFLKLRQPQPVQAATLETLARFDRPEVATFVLDAWPGLSPQLRASAAETLFSRPAWIGAFLDAVESGKVGRGDVDPARIQLLQSSRDEKLRQRAAKLFAGAGLPRRQEVVAAYQKALQLKGDPARGKTAFKNHCSACHRLEGVGESIGADLSAIRDRGPDGVLLNILDPNREVKPQFLSYVLTTDAGRTLTGMIAAETATSITIRKPDGASETVLRVNIDDLRSTGLSFMPEGLEKQVDLQAMADLLAYLNSIK